MPETVILTLSAIAYLLVKHTVADYLLQTPYMFLNKGRYGHPGGLLHAGLHALLTAPVFAVLAPPSSALAMLVLGGEFLAHYHFDWMKERLTVRHALTPKSARYWNLHGVDQLFHLLTYVAIVAVLSRTL